MYYIRMISRLEILRARMLRATLGLKGAVRVYGNRSFPQQMRQTT